VIHAETFISANVFPVKLLQVNVLDDQQRIKPVHLVLIPTNKCNLNCSFCSSGNRNKTHELPIEELIEIITLFKNLGTLAVTISGGGEPLIHPHINELIEYILAQDIKVGLATNGTLLHLLDKQAITWCRISLSDEHRFGAEQQHMLANNILRLPNIDIAFSYVITDKPNISKIISVIEFAYAYKCSHVRLSLDFAGSTQMALIKRAVQDYTDDSNVIYHDRPEFKDGNSRCLLSLLKPLVDANGDVHACCGVRHNIQLRKFDMFVCHWTAYFHMFDTQQCFDGSMCKRCWYSKYNSMLSYMTGDTKHKEFI